MTSLKRLTGWTLASLAVLTAHPALCADSASTPPALRLVPARSAIAARQWAVAIEELKKVEDPASADWNNLMGYSLRKAKTPNYAAAERYYDTALRIDPEHRGALSYSGELYLMQGDLAKAEQRQASLVKLCAVPCKELDKLRAAIDNYKAAGNRYVPSD